MFKIGVRFDHLRPKPDGLFSPSLHVSARKLEESVEKPDSNVDVA